MGLLLSGDAPLAGVWSNPAELMAGDTRNQGSIVHVLPVDPGRSSTLGYPAMPRITDTGL